MQIKSDEPESSAKHSSGLGTKAGSPVWVRVCERVCVQGVEEGVLKDHYLRENNHGHGPSHVRRKPTGICSSPALKIKPDGE